MGRRDHGLAAATDGDGLASAGVPRVLVRLDDAGRDDDIGVLHDPLRGPWHAVRRDRAEIGPLRRIAAIRIDDAHAVDDAAELLALLSVGRRAVQTHGDDHHDAVIGDAAGVQLVEERRDEDVVGTVAREVGDGDDRGGTGPHSNGLARELCE